jgi:opacity protein-like surface antigen
MIRLRAIAADALTTTRARAARVAAAVAFCAVPLAAAAQADEEQVYWGLGIGQSSYDWKNPPAGVSEFCGNVGQLSCRDDPIGFKGFIGYNFRKSLGVELMYYSPGAASQKFDSSLGGVLEQKVVLRGFALSAVGTLPLGPAFISGRAGVAASTITRKDELFGQQQSSDNTTAQPTIGAGFGFKVWRNTALRLDWDRVRGKTAGGEKFDADFFTLNFMMRHE